MGLSPDRVKPKTIKLVFVASPLSTQHEGERAKTDWLGIGIMCPIEVQTVVSVSYHYKNPTKRVDLVQSRLHHHLIEPY